MEKDCFTDMTIDNQLWEILNALDQNIGVTNPFADFHSTVDQSATSLNTLTKVVYDAPSITNGITLVSNSRITFTQSGTYQILSALGFRNTGGGGSGTTVDVWLCKNLINYPNSTKKFDVDTNSPYASRVYIDIVNIVAGDFVEICWATDNTSILLEHQPATSLYPDIPSATLNAFRISQ